MWDYLLAGANSQRAGFSRIQTHLVKVILLNLISCPGKDAWMFAALAPCFNANPFSLCALSCPAIAESQNLVSLWLIFSVQYWLFLFFYFKRFPFVLHHFGVSENISGVYGTSHSVSRDPIRSFDVFSFHCVTSSTFVNEKYGSDVIMQFHIDIEYGDASYWICHAKDLRLHNLWQSYKHISTGYVHVIY